LNNSNPFSTLDSASFSFSDAEIVILNINVEGSGIIADNYARGELVLLYPKNSEELTKLISKAQSLTKKEFFQKLYNMVKNIPEPTIQEQMYHHVTN
jgi:hypothetical protein